MKLYFAVSLLLTHLYCTSQKTSAGQSFNPDSKIDSIIKTIRKSVAAINSDSTNRHLISKSIEGESSEGGEVRRIYSNHTLCKGIIIFYGETGKETSEYYFADGKVIFMYARTEYYNEPIYMNGSKINRVVENRYYLSNSKIIWWLEGKKRIRQDLYPSKAMELKKDIKKYLMDSAEN